VRKALESGCGFGKRSITSFYAMTYPGFSASWLVFRLGCPCLSPIVHCAWIAMLQNKVYGLVCSLPVGDVPASGPALEKLNDRKVILSAPKDHVRRSQAHTQASAGRRISKATLVSL
jgi:hypothetical protein